MHATPPPPRYWRATAGIAHLFGGVWLHATAALDASGELSFPRVHGSEFWAWLAVRDAQTLGDRCTFVEGSFFESVPHGDAHLLSTVLHDWDDRSARRILETVRAREPKSQRATDDAGWDRAALGPLLESSGCCSTPAGRCSARVSGCICTRMWSPTGSSRSALGSAPTSTSLISASRCRLRAAPGR